MYPDILEIFVTTEIIIEDPIKTEKHGIYCKISPERNLNKTKVLNHYDLLASTSQSVVNSTSALRPSVTLSIRRVVTS